MLPIEFVHKNTYLIEKNKIRGHFVSLYSRLALSLLHKNHEDRLRLGKKRK